MYDNLFSPIKIRGLELSNRVVFPAMGTKMGDGESHVTTQLIEYHVARVKGGCGLNILEVCSVYAKSSPKNFLAISDDKYIKGLKDLTDAIHNAGGKIGVQLWIGGAAVSSDPTAMIIVPSEKKLSGIDYTIPAASVETITECIQAYGDAARRAVEAGFDCIEFQTGHNYAAHTFLSAAFNHRTDEYGGSLENRSRFLIDSIKSIRNNIPEGMPIFMRINAHDDYLENGLTIEEVIEFCKNAKVAGVDVLNISRGNFSTDAIKYEIPPLDITRGFNVENASRIRKETGMLTVAVGRINDPWQADRIIRDNKADMVVIGRGQLADSEFCNKSKSGDTDRIVKCVGCNQGCYDGFVSPEMPHITCMRNPSLGIELEYELKKTENAKKVLIAGGGVAGLEAALILKRRGHNPVLFESTEFLGGQFYLAGKTPRKDEMKDAAIWMGKEAKRENIEMYLSTPVTTEVVNEIKPDEVIIAVGANPLSLNVPGINLPHVTNSHDVLRGKDNPKGNVVIIGGGLVGLEVSEFLSPEVDDITVVEMLDKVGKDLGYMRRICVMESIKELGIKTITSAKCVEIKEHSVVVEKEGKLQEIKCDSVVIAIGSRSRNFDDIKLYCEENNIPYHVIGDAFKSRRAFNSIKEANEIARKI